MQNERSSISLAANNKNPGSGADLVEVQFRSDKGGGLLGADYKAALKYKRHRLE